MTDTPYIDALRTVSTGALPPVGADLVLDIRDLRVAFQDGRGLHEVVKGVSLSVAAGHCLAIVGESGSGKSVTSRSIVGLAGENSVVDCAAHLLGGHDVRGLTPRQWREVRGSRVGFVLQDALGALDPLRTVGAEVGDPLVLHTRERRRRRRQRVLDVLTEVGVPGAEQRAAQRPYQLSGGLRQRALIASAIINNPALLIADEPTTALDVSVQAQVLNLLAGLKAAGTAIVLVTHDLAVASQLADHIVVMRDGEIVERGSTAAVLDDPAHEYTRQLLAAVPSAATRGLRLSDDRHPPRNQHRQTSAAGGDHLAVEAHAVSTSFTLPNGTSLHAVSNVDFTIRRGEIVGLVGESGSGKSTLARIVMGAIRPDAGTITISGLPWSQLSERQRRPHRSLVQLIPQDPMASFDPRHLVGDILDEALDANASQPRKVCNEADHRTDRRRELLSLVGLEHLTPGTHPRTLSGGQRQRLAIARALAVGPSILVCDEPVSALDVSVQAQILDLLGDLRAELGLSVLFISHDLGVVEHLCDRILVMQSGKIVEEGDAATLFDKPTHPYTRSLAAAVPRLQPQTR